MIIEPQGEPLGITPAHVFITLISGTLVISGILWKIMSTIAKMQLQMSMMWKDFQKRYKIENGEE